MKLGKETQVDLQVDLNTRLVILKHWGGIVGWYWPPNALKPGKTLSLSESLCVSPSEVDLISLPAWAVRRLYTILNRVSLLHQGRIHPSH